MGLIGLTLCFLGFTCASRFEQLYFLRNDYFLIGMSIVIDSESIGFGFKAEFYFAFVKRILLVMTVAVVIAFFTIPKRLQFAMLGASFASTGHCSARYLHYFYIIPVAASVVLRQHRLVAAARVRVAFHCEVRVILIIRVVEVDLLINSQILHRIALLIKAFVLIRIAVPTQHVLGLVHAFLRVRFALQVIIANRADGRALQFVLVIVDVVRRVRVLNGRYI